MAVCDIKRDVWFIIVRLYQKDGVGMAYGRNN